MRQQTFWAMLYTICVLYQGCLPEVYAQRKIQLPMKNDHLAEKAIGLKDELSPRDSEYKLVYTLKNKINDTDVFIFRFQPIGNESVTLKGNHVTVILDESGKLKGFARLNEDMMEPNHLGEDLSKELALSFLQKYAPDLTNSRFQWTDSHKEKVITTDGKEKTISGTWVKYKEPKSGEYLWVILAPDGSPMEFDRDIVWSFFRGGRVNELWLRDDWFGKWLDKNK